MPKAIFYLRGTIGVGNLSKVVFNMIPATGIL